MILQECRILQQACLTHTCFTGQTICIDFNCVSYVCSHSGVIGSGLCIFSKYPIVGSYFHQFMSSGGIFDMHKGDVFAGKGVGMCRVKLDERNHLSIYTAHVS